MRLTTIRSTWAVIADAIQGVRSDALRREIRRHEGSAGQRRHAWETRAGFIDRVTRPVLTKVECDYGSSPNSEIFGSELHPASPLRPAIRLEVRG